MANYPTSLRPGVYTQTDIYSAGAAPSCRGGAVVAQGGAGDTPGAVVTLCDAQADELADGTMLHTLALALWNAGVRPVYAVAAGEDYAAAYAACRTLPVAAVLADGGAQALAEHIDSCCDAGRERIGVVGISDPEQARETAQALNCAGVLIACDGGTKAHLAAAGLAAAALNDGAQSFSGAEISFAGSFDGTLTDEQVELLLAAGVTPVEQADGRVLCVRARTTKTRTNGALDGTFSDLSTVLAVHDVLRSVRGAVERRLHGLRNNPVTRASIASQITVELQAKRTLGVIDSFEPPQVQTHPQDAGICVAVIAVRVAPEVQQIVLRAQFLV